MAWRAQVSEWRIEPNLLVEAIATGSRNGDKVSPGVREGESDTFPTRGYFPGRSV